MRRVARAAALAGLMTLTAAPSGAGAAAIERFPLSDREPFSAILGIPDGWTDPTGPAVELAWHIANNAVAQQSGAESLLLDGETHTVTLRLQRRLNPRLSVGVEVPWISHSGGFLDPLIDDWHRAFGLSQGIRPYLPTGELQYVYARDGVDLTRLDGATSGIGDVRTSAALRLVGAPGDTNRLLLDVTADVEWPTGDAGRLTGSGGTDLAAGLRLAGPVSRPGEPGSRLGWSVSTGLVWPGNVDLPLPPPSGQILYYDASLAWAALQSLDLVLQAQGHTGDYQSDLKMLGSAALQFGGGVIWHVSHQYSVRFGIFEDIRTDTTPDFATELSLTYRPGD